MERAAIYQRAAWSRRVDIWRRVGFWRQAVPLRRAVPAPQLPAALQAQVEHLLEREARAQRVGPLARAGLSFAARV